MDKHRLMLLTRLVLVLALISWLVGQGFAREKVITQAQKGPEVITDAAGRVHTLSGMRRTTQAERKAAAQRLKAARDAALAAGVAAPVPLPGGVPDVFGIYPNYANSPLGIRKFVDPLPGLPIAHPDVVTYPGSDYYEIALQQYSAQMHTDLPATTLRGYVQLNNGTDTTACGGAGQPACDLTFNTVAPAPIQYLGPVIVALRGRPVRVKFINQLPTGVGGNLFIPVDTTYMGAGLGPDGVNSYKQNRATLHLHGGAVPWVSDGTPHQWTTPASESTPYPKGVSVYNVPDMPNPGAPATPDPGAGTLTFFYNNQQSARLMFYHDHVYGITRLNVYAGEAAGYLLTDQVEQDLINGTNLSGGNPLAPKVILPDVGTPLVIQDKTFVDASKIGTQDPTWNGPLLTGSLWFPHVYMPNQNPYDISGANPMGRWDYGPWFWPPFTGITYGPITNPYYDPACVPSPTVYCEPPFMPGTPDARGLSPSGVPEAFMDTPVVNGKAYPFLQVEPKAYRFRILNACNDRMLNLQLHRASPIVGGITVNSPGSGYTSNPLVTMAPAVGDVTGHGATATATVDLTPGSATYGQVTAVTLLSVGSGYTLAPIVTIAPPLAGVQATATANLYIAPTEVGMVPAAPGTWPPGWPRADGRDGGFPDAAMMGPSMIQIGTEGGVLPTPVVIPNRPVGYDYNRRSITVLNVLEKALFLGPAERADVVVDFSAFAGQTLILYNDAPAPVPAFDPRLDYYTGDPDHTDTGGAPSTLPGYGPNTRTIMQIRVDLPLTTPSTVSLADLQTALPAAFAASQDTIIVPQAPYNAVYGGTFPGDATAYVKIQDNTFSFTPIGAAAPVTLDLEPKAIVEDFQMDFGRMNALLGVEVPRTSAMTQTTIPQAYIDPPTEVIKFSDKATPIGTLGDGTQLWKLTHNGVDTHAIHFHMFNVQVINRVGWDGAIKPPAPNELGWKDTVLMNPLEDVAIAVRPMGLVNLPFKLPNSIRLLDPTRPLGSTMGFFNINPTNGNPVTITNQLTNFGWEHVWHCHILGHEENDMMRGMALAVAPEAPSNLVATLKGGSPLLTWMDNSLNETSFIVQRAADAGFTTKVVTFTVAAGVTTFTDKTYKANGTPYYYRVFARNTVGSTVAGYPRVSADSAFSNVVGPPAGTMTLLSLTKITGALVLTWSYVPGGDQTGFTIQRATDAGFTTGVTLFKVAGNVTSYSDTSVKAGVTYWYRVMATNFLGNGTWSNSMSLGAAVKAAGH